MADIQLTAFPVILLSSILTTKCIKKKMEFRIYLKTFFIIQANCIFIFLLMRLLSQKPATFWQMQLIRLYFFIESALGTISFILLGSFFLRICDFQLGGTYLTYLNSFANFGSLWTKYFWLKVLGHLSLNALAAFGLTFNIAFFLLYRKTLQRLEVSDKQEWQLQLASPQAALTTK